MTNDSPAFDTHVSHTDEENGNFVTIESHAVFCFGTTTEHMILL